jgi:hypothetical protein
MYTKNEIFSKRNLKKPDIFRYEGLNKELKTQVFLIWDEFFSQETINKPLVGSIWESIYKTLQKEHALLDLYQPTLLGERHDIPYKVRQYFLLELGETDKLLDVIEVIFKLINGYETIIKNLRGHFEQLIITPADAINELNDRFIENGVGFEFTQNQIIRIDNKILHEEIVKSTLFLTTDPVFNSVNKEFISACEHLRHGRLEESSNDCLKAFESTLKILCSIRGWNYSETDTSNTLIKICFENKFIPDYLQAYAAGIRQILEAGVPTIRNRNSAHGKGTSETEMPEHLAVFMLYLTGATINYLMDSNNAIQESESSKAAISEL